MIANFRPQLSTELRSSSRVAMRRLRWLLVAAVLLASCGQPTQIESPSSARGAPLRSSSRRLHHHSRQPRTPCGWSVPAWMGGIPAELTETFGRPTSTRRCVPGALLSAPSGGEIREYKRPWGGFSATFEQGQTAGLMAYFVKQRPRDHDDALRVLNLPATPAASAQRPPCVAGKPWWLCRRDDRRERAEL